MDSINVAEILAALSDRSEKAGMASSNIESLLAQQAELERRSKDELEAAATDANYITTVSGQGLLAAQDATLTAKKLLEGDVTNPNSLKAKSMEEFVRRTKEANLKLESIKEMQSVSFLDDPLGYISNQLDMPKVIQDYNLTAVQANGALRVVNDINSTLTNEAQANKATAVTQNTATVAAAARLAANSYNLQANQAEYKALGLQAEANKVIDSGNATQVNMLLKQYEVINSEEARGRQKLEYDIQRKRFDQWEAERKDTMESKQYVRGLISTGMGVLGMKQPDDNTINAYEQAYKTPEGRKNMQHIIDAGMRKLATGMSIIGGSPAESLYTVAAVGDYSKGKEYAPAIAAIKTVADQLIADKTKNLDPRKPDTFKPALNAAMGTITKQWNLDPENSPVFKAPTVERMAQVDVVANTAWFKEVIAPSLLAAKANNATVPPMPAKAMYAQTMEAVSSGKLSIEQAALGISTYYSMATKVNAIKNGVVGIGPQEGYKVNLGVGIFSETRDLSNYAVVTNTLLTDRVGQIKELYDFIDKPLSGLLKSAEPALDSMGLDKYRR